jgi:Fe-S cluster biogenesis protein NfuA/alkylated DNA nucleotide flippase Atl1
MGFVLDDPLAERGPVRFDAASDAPLPRALFALDGVARVEVSGGTVWVGKTDGANWTALKPAIAAALRAVLDATDAPLGDDAGDDADAALLAAVRDLLDRQVNPAVAAHGGQITAERAEGTTVFLRMSGGCQGCAASAATLRHGVERMLRAALPRIREIVDMTDHAAGDAPFYTADRGASPLLHRPVPPGVIDRVDGQVTVDPDYLAPRLGLTPDTLRAGLRSGDVVGVTETGAGTDAGRTRIVMRSATRAWAAEIDADGSAREVPPPRPAVTPGGAEQTLADRVRAHLTALPDGGTVTYGALARAMGLWAPGSVRRVTRALETTMREDAAVGRAFIAARAVSRTGGGLPARGFFETATALSRGPDGPGDDAAFHAAELARLDAAEGTSSEEGTDRVANVNHV